VQNDVSQPAGVSKHVEVAADALRAAIHSVYDDPAPGDRVGELYRTVGDLSLVVDRLPQLVNHLARRVERLADVDGLHTDPTTETSGPDTARAAAEALEAAALGIASLSAGRTSPVSDAEQLLSTLTVSRAEGEQ